MRQTLLALTASTLALGATALCGANAQDAITLSGQIEENYGEDGFVLRYGDTDVAVATGQLYDDNPDLRLKAGQRVTVYAVPTAEFFEDRIVDADGVYLMGMNQLVRVAQSALGEDAYSTASADDDAMSMRDALAERSRSRTASAADRAGRPDRAERSARRPDRTDREAEARATYDQSEDEEFAAYDRNGDGVVTLDEYIRVAARPDNITRSEAARLFEALARGDRLMTRREFLEPPDRYERLSERFLSN